MNRDRVLIVDDEENICELVKTYLSEDFNILTAPDGYSGLEKFRKNNIDLVILDIMLPGLNGFDVCRQIRQTGNIPIIMLTAKDDDVDKIIGLELGADDYVTKPFNPKELLARVKAVLRRYKVPREETREIIEYPGMEINKTTRQVIVSGEEVDLTPREFELLWLFANNPGTVFSREQMIQLIWGFDYMGDSRAIDNAIKRLRRKLEAVQGAQLFIQTVWGVGYKFEVTM